MKISFPSMPSIFIIEAMNDLCMRIKAEADNFSYTERIYSLNFSESFKLPRNYAIELSGNYNSSSFGSNSKNYANTVFNMGFKKDLDNNHGSFRLSISDIFGGSNYRGFGGALIADAFDTHVNINYQPESYFRPIIKLSYSRSFGAANKKSSHKNNGTKDEQDRL